MYEPEAHADSPGLFASAVFNAPGSNECPVLWARPKNHPRWVAQGDTCGVCPVLLSYINTHTHTNIY